jgi:GT2 family glycosyltransferase
VNYNGGELVLRCLESVYQGAAGIPLEVIVVDNASGDGSPSAIADRFPQVRLVRNAQNRGFATAVNQGLRLARGDYIILLNNDASFLESRLPGLVRFMEGHPEAAVVGPKVLNPDGSIQPSCFQFPAFRDILFESLMLRQLFPRSDFFNRRNMGGFQHNELREVDWVLGACLIVRRAVAEAAGPMDERYFMYGEELDWCRAIRKLGHRIYYWPEPTIVHYGQQGSRRIRPEVLRRGFQSRYYYFEKHHGPAYARWVRVATFFGMSLRLIFTLAASLARNRSEYLRQARGYLGVLRMTVGRE